MEYGKLISRSATLVWENKYLILLGVIASLASGGGGGGGSGGSSSFDQSGQGNVDPEVAGIAIGIIIAIVLVALAIGIVIWLVSTIARGGLVAGVNTIESGKESSFRHAWSAGWERAGSLIGISLIPAIPGFVLLILGLLAFGAYSGIFALVGEGDFMAEGLAGVGIVMAVLLCIILPVALVLSALRIFAERACMLEGLGVMDSYRRGWEVLKANLGDGILLFILQVVISVGLAIALFLPGIIIALCCFLWPLFLAFGGYMNAFFSSMWTLAWREWTLLPDVPAEKAAI